MTNLNQSLHNPHLDGEPFLWERGETAVLLSHGLTATPAEVRLLAENLQAAGFTIAAPLLAGHGTTPEDLNQTKWQEWVWSVEQVYHELATRCEHVFVGGESTGAVIALYLASRYADINGVLNYAPAIKLAIPEPDMLKLKLSAPFMTSIPKEGLDRSDRWQGYRVNPLKAALELVKLGEIVIDLLPTIQQPVFVVQGGLDTTIHPDSGKIIIEGVASEIKELHWMEHSSHVVLLDNELDRVTEFTLNFIRRIQQREHIS